MPHPLSPIQTQINAYFPPQDHPYRVLERRIDARLTSNSTLCDIGCGRTAPTLKKFRGKALDLIGIDPVEFVDDIQDVRLVNGSIENMGTIASNSIDVAYSRSVMEHIADGDAAIAEIRRILKPGGTYIFLTANRYDYVSLIASIVPNRFHASIVKATEGRAEIDTFPTTYLANSKRKIYKLARSHSLDVQRFERLVQYPAYLTFSRPLFWLGCQYERLLANAAILSVLRGWILCELKKTSLV